MEKVEKGSGKKTPLRWFIELVFVLGLIACSGHVSAFTFARSEPVRIELQEKRRSNFKQTISLEKAFHRLLWPSTSKDFASYLMQYGSLINVRFKNNIQELPEKKLRVKSMTTYYSNDHSDAEKG